MRVVFVCAGNICRSPSALYFFRRQAAALGIESLSFGLVAEHDDCPIEETVRAARAYQVDVSDHRARRFEAGLVRVDDLILVMERTQVDAIRAALPLGVKAEVRLLGEYVHGGPLEIDDPGEKSWAEFERCMRELDAAVKGLVTALTT